MAPENNAPTHFNVMVEAPELLRRRNIARGLEHRDHRDQPAMLSWTSMCVVLAPRRAAGNASMQKVKWNCFALLIQVDHVLV
jgi:hypothetical protein